MSKKKRPLTMKETKLIKAKAQGKTHKVAAKEAGYSGNENTLKAIASETLSKPNVQEALDAELKRQGITLEAVVAPVKKALTAKKIQIHGNAEDAFAEEVEDVELQLKGHDRAVKLMGLNKQVQVEGGVHFHQHVEEMRGKYVKE